MERLTEKRQWQNTIPLIKENSKKRFTHLWNGVKCVDIRDCCIGIVKGHICGEAVNRLAAYEDTGLTPEEVETLKAFKAYFDDMYGKGLEVANWHMNGNLEPFDNFYEKASNAAKIRCKDCDYLNMDDGKPYCCHARMSTNGLDDWCYYGVKRKENNNA